MSPTAVPARTPYTMMGPATTNIFAAVPQTQPSVLNSTAGDATELAKPVMGTMLPAPAFFPMRSQTPSPVNSTPKKMSIAETVPERMSPVSPASSSMERKNCPTQQMSPPTKKALMLVLTCCVGGSKVCTQAMQFLLKFSRERPVTGGPPPCPPAGSRSHAPPASCSMDWDGSFSYPYFGCFAQRLYESPLILTCAISETKQRRPRRPARAASLIPSRCASRRMRRRRPTNWLH